MAWEDTETLTVLEASRRLGLSLGVAYRAANAGEIPAVRIGGRILVLRRPLDRLLSGDSVLHGRSSVPPDDAGERRVTDRD